MDDSLTGRSIIVNFRPSTGKLFDYNFDPGQLTVRQLKEKLATHTSIPADSMRLVYSGRVLKDEDMMESYGVKEGHTIHVVRGADNRAAEQASNVPSTTAPPAVNSFGSNNRQFSTNTNTEQDIMRSMINSPMMRHLLSNPEIVRSMVMQNPTMRQMIERNPEIGHIINDPSFIRQTMDMARNPELMREMMRNNDRALANLETIPGGFNHLRRMYHTLQEPLESAGRHNDQSSEAANQRLAQMLNVERPPEGRLNNTPLPNPWAPRTNNNLSNPPFSSISLGNPFGAFTSLGFPGLSPSLLNITTPSTSGRTSTSAPTSSQTSSAQTNAASTTPTTNNTSFDSFPQTGSSSTLDPDITRRFQQVMQRYATSSPYLSRQQIQQQTFYPTSLFGSQNPFFMNMQSPFGAPQPPTSQPTEPPEVRFRIQLETLEEMGFVDQAANIRALLAAGGDVNSAIEWLLQNPNS